MNLLNDGIPVGISSLQSWNYNRTMVFYNSDTNVYYYSINEGGYLEQAIFTNIKKNKDITITLYFDSDTHYKIIAECGLRVYFKDGSVDYLIVPMICSTNQYENEFSISHTYKTPDNKIIDRVIAKLHNKSNKELRVSSISVDYDNYQDVLDEYDLKKFQDNVILYGLDADKPKLR